MENYENMKFCQSCAMPMSDGDYASNADGSKNEDYCRYCFKDGAFTKEETMEEMIETCIPFMTEGGKMTANEARAMMNEALPKLKRWAK